MAKRVSCAEIQAWMNDFMDGLLDADQAMDLTGHLHACKTCQREWKALEATRNLVRAAQLPDSQGSQERVLARFRQRVAGEAFDRAPASRRSGRRIAALPLGLATAAAALGLAGLLFLLQPALVPPASPPADVWPSRDEVNRMLTLHAIHSADITADAPELHHYVLADANSSAEEESAEGDL